LWKFGIDPLLSAELLVDPFSRCDLRSSMKYLVLLFAAACCVPRACDTSHVSSTSFISVAEHRQRHLPI
jgi:hypothetical protein